MTLAILAGREQAAVHHAPANGKAVSFRTAFSDLGAGLASHGVSERRAVVVLPRSLLLFRDFELPGGTPEEIERMIRFQLDQQMSVPVAELVYGYRAERKADGGSAIAVAAIRKPDWEALRAKLTAAGVAVEGAVPASACLAAACPEGAAAWAVPEGIEFGLFRGGRPVIGRWVDGADAEAAATEWRRAEVAARTKEASLSADGVKAFAPAEAAAAWARAGIPAKPEADEWAPLGKAADALAAGPNLLAAPARTPFHVRHRTRILAAGVAAAVLLSAIVVRWIGAARQNELSDLNGRLAAIEPQKDEVQAMEAKLLVAQEWSARRTRWHRLLAAVNDAVGPVQGTDRGIYVTALRIDSTPVRGGGTRWILRMDGRARDDSPIDGLASALRDVPGLENIGAPPTQRHEGQAYPVEFSVEATVVPSRWGPE